MCVFPLLTAELVSLMEALATLSANGFEAVYIEVVSVIMVDELGRFFRFLSPLDGNYIHTHTVGFLQTLPRLWKWTGRDSVLQYS